jgi:hypothetical protein
MWPYWILFLIPALISLKQSSINCNRGVKWPTVWWLVLFFLTLMIGLRDEVGGDWSNYVGHLDKAESEGLMEALLQSDPAYKLLNWLAVQIGLGIHFVNSVGALIFSWGLVVFCRRQPRPWLALAVAIPYLVIVVAMGYTRQGISIGLVLAALVALSDKALLRYFCLMALAVMFHKSAIIMIPLVAFSSAGNKWWRMFLLLSIGITLYWVLVRDSTDYMVANYIGAEYDSQGAAIRVTMNAVPAIIYLFIYKRFQLPKDEQKFWALVSIGALAFIVLLLISPSSTAVDRVALYWIPLQIYVFSRLPDALGRPGSLNMGWTLTIVLYYTLVLFVWLVFAVHSTGWLPYRFYPWIWLWDLPSKYQFVL